MTNGTLRQAKASDTYVSEILAAQAKLGGRKLSSVQKKQKIALMLQDKNSGFDRLGASMIGPIQLKLRYQGIVRNALREDALTPGQTPEYEVLDDLGQAYMLHGNEGEVKITPFEGKRILLQLFRIAAFPQVKKEDLYLMRADMVEQAQDESKQAIMKQEDSRWVSLMEAAVNGYTDRRGNSHVVTAPAGYLTPNVFYDAVTVTDQVELESGRIFMNLARSRDLYRWDINTTGWAFKDDVVAGQKITSFGEFQIGKSIMIPDKTTYLTAAPEFTGVMPVMYSLDVEENHKVEAFHRGWVLDEYIGMSILNRNGIVKIVTSV